MAASSSWWDSCGCVEDEEDYVGFGHGFAGFCNADGFGFVGGVARQAVSMSSTGMPSRETRSVTRSRVVPGVAVTMARSRLTKRLKREDLPTFGRPTIAKEKPSRTMRP